MKNFLYLIEKTHTPIGCLCLLISFSIFVTSIFNTRFAVRARKSIFGILPGHFEEERWHLKVRHAFFYDVKLIYPS